MDIQLTKPQSQLFLSKHKFTAMVSGYGAGKTHALIATLLHKKIKHPKCLVAMYEPTTDLIDTIAMPRVEEILEQSTLKYKPNRSKRFIDIEKYGKILFRTMERPQRIVGYETAYSFIDELDTLPRRQAQQVWSKVISRNREKNGENINQIFVGTTPEGFRLVYELWERDVKEGYHLIRASTLSNCENLPEDYIENLKTAYPSHALDAYIEGMFVNLEAGTVYPQFNKELNNSTETEDGSEPLRIGMDFNVTKMYACVSVNRNDNIHVIDEFVGVYDTPAMIQLIKERYAGRSIVIHPDASGNARKTVGASETDLSLLRDAGFYVSTRRSNPLVRDRVVTVNARFLNGKGDRTLFINSNRAPVLVECLTQQAYDKNGMPEKGRDNDHAPDALGYLAYDMKSILTMKLQVT